MPRFDEPDYTRDCDLVVRDAHVPNPAPLPTLWEPRDQPLVACPVAEPLVAVEHRRIRSLGNYWHAGWATAIPGCWLRAEATTRLYSVADSLPPRWGLAIFDAWRPIELQAELYEAAYRNPGLPPGFVAFPEPDPERPPPHLTGGAVDVTLTFDGTPLALGTGFDSFTAHAEAMALEDTPGTVRELRRMLFWAMQAHDFVLLTFEWWHFEFGSRRWAAIRGVEPTYGPTHGPTHGPRVVPPT